MLQGGGGAATHFQRPQFVAWALFFSKAFRNVILITNLLLVRMSLPLSQRALHARNACQKCMMHDVDVDAIVNPWGNAAVPAVAWITGAVYYAIAASGSREVCMACLFR